MQTEMQDGCSQMTGRTLSLCLGYHIQSFIHYKLGSYHFKHGMYGEMLFAFFSHVTFGAHCKYYPYVCIKLTEFHFT